MQRSAVIDLNADVGEGVGDDGALLALITSANIACGEHAGDPDTMRRTAERAVRGGVVIGAHPGYPDRAGFGRLPLELAASELDATIAHQLAALDRTARLLGTQVRYVKPHGALYHRLEADADAARTAAATLTRALPSAAWLAAPGSRLLAEAQARGIVGVTEAFADRRYRRGPDGTALLVPRSEPGALLAEDEAVAQAVALATDGRVTAADGAELRVVAQSLCLHGDTPGAADLAARIRAELGAAGVTIRSFAR